MISFFQCQKIYAQNILKSNYIIFVVKMVPCWFSSSLSKNMCNWAAQSISGPQFCGSLEISKLTPKSWTPKNPAFPVKMFQDSEVQTLRRHHAPIHSTPLFGTFIHNLTTLGHLKTQKLLGANQENCHSDVFTGWYLWILKIIQECKTVSKVSRSFLWQQCGLDDFGKGQKDGTEIWVICIN